MSDPRAQLQAMVQAKLMLCCPACAGVEASGGAQHLRLPEARYLSERLMELFSTVAATSSWPIADGREDFDNRPYLMACTEPGTAVSGLDGRVVDGFRSLGPA